MDVTKSIYQRLHACDLLPYDLLCFLAFSSRLVELLHDQLPVVVRVVLVFQHSPPALAIRCAAKPTHAANELVVKKALQISEVGLPALSSSSTGLHPRYDHRLHKQRDSETEHGVDDESGHLVVKRHGVLGLHIQTVKGTARCPTCDWSAGSRVALAAVSINGRAFRCRRRTA